MSDKIPLVMIPGLLCDSGLWQAQVDALRDVADIVIPDLRPFDSIAGMAEYVLEMAPADYFSLAGLSMGGYVSFEIMRRAPERVDRLALIATSARPDSKEHAKRRRMLLSQAQHGRFKGVTPKMLPRLINEKHLKNDEITRRITQMATRIGREAFIRHQSAILGRPDSRAVLGEIQCPALVICGAEDSWTPLECSEEIAAEIPRARLEVIPDSGHLPPLEQPDRVSELLAEWIN